MAKKIPSLTEVREYLKNKPEIFEATFPNEAVWRSRMTLPFLEAAEAVGIITPNENIWEFCKKISSFSHAPVTLKYYERMLPFAQKNEVVDAVLKLLENYGPNFSEKEWYYFYDIIGFYYCVALISQSDYRKEDCEARLWTIVDSFIKNDTENHSLYVLLRNMSVLQKKQPNLASMREKLEAAIKS